jgi:hypothetical protein
MIIRIAGEGQFRFPSSELDHLNDIDLRIVDAVGRGDEAAFKGHFTELLEVVRSKGAPLPPDEIDSSDVVLPYPDLSLNEARHLFVGDGLIPV